jgi:hypothetical protein
MAVAGDHVHQVRVQQLTRKLLSTAAEGTGQALPRPSPRSLRPTASLPRAAVSAPPVSNDGDHPGARSRRDFVGVFKRAKGTYQQVVFSGG